MTGSINTETKWRSPRRLSSALSAELLVYWYSANAPLADKPFLSISVFLDRNGSLLPVIQDLVQTELGYLFGRVERTHDDTWTRSKDRTLE